MTKKVLAVLMGIAMFTLVCGQAFAELDEPPASNLTVQEPVSADIVFFIDASGSMYEEIQSVKDNVVKFANELKDKKVNARFAVIEFYDDYGTNYDIVQYIMVHSNTNNNSHWLTAEEVATALGKIEVGGDETITLALKQVLPGQNIFVNKDGNQEGFRDGVYHFGFLLTDEPAEYTPGVPNWYVDTSTYTKLADLIEPLGNIMKLSVITGLDCKDFYRDLFMNTEGVFIDINREDYWRSMLDIANWIVDVVVQGERTLPYTTIEIINPSAISSALNKIVEVVNNIVININITINNFIIMTEENYNKFDPSLPRELSSQDWNAASGDVLTKLDTITLYPDNKVTSGDYGYFLFKLNLNIEVNGNLTVGNSESFDQAESEFVPFILFDGDGNKLTTITKETKEVFLFIYGKVNETLTLYLVKDSDGNVRLWAGNRANRTNTPSDQREEDNQEGTIDKEEAESKGIKSVVQNVWDKGELSWEDAKELASYIVDWLKENKDNIVETVKNAVSGGGGGGCDAGLGLVGVLALAGLAFRKR